MNTIYFPFKSAWAVGPLCATDIYRNYLLACILHTLTFESHMYEAYMHKILAKYLQIPNYIFMANFPDLGYDKSLVRPFGSPPLPYVKPAFNLVTTWCYVS